MQYFHPWHVFMGVQESFEASADVVKDGRQLSDAFSLYCLSPTLATLKLSSSMARQDRSFTVTSHK